MFDRDGDGRITVNELRSALGWLDPMTMPVDTEPPLFYGTHANNQPLRRTVGAYVGQQYACAELSFLLLMATPVNECSMTSDDEVRNILRVCSTHRDGSIHYEVGLYIANCN